MAMKPLHYCALAVAGCTLVAASLLPPSEAREARMFRQTPNPLVKERNRLRDEAGAAIASWRALAMRDSLLQVLATTDEPQRGSTPIVIAIDGTPDNLRILAERLIQREWQSLGIDSPRVPTVSVVMQRSTVLDSNSVWAQQGFFHLVPRHDGASPDACVGVAAFAMQDKRALSQAADRLIFGAASQEQYPGLSASGTCAFFAAFGKPGQLIDRWLESRGYEPAMASRWDVARHPRTRSKLYGAHLFAGMIQETDIWSTSLDARRCLLGDADVCSAAMLKPLPPRGASLTEGLYRANYGYGSTFPEIAIGYLAAMRREYGAEKFTTFWTSNLEPAAAFEQATGEPIGQWTLRWARHELGETVGGARVPSNFFGWGAIIALGCVSVAAVVARRREVR
jgi:hypothetical protein